MKYYSINENYIARRGQRVFRIEKPFVNEIISVFLNGELQTLGEDKDYLTVQDTGKVIFNSPLHEGDCVQVISSIASTSITLEVVSPGHSDRKNTLYRKYSTDRKFKMNNLYSVRICIDKDFIDWQFSSQLQPFFATVRQVRQQIGEFIEGVTDDHIASLIYKNSVQVVELIDQLANQDDPVENVEYEYNQATGEYTTTYRAVKNWVLYQTCIDLIYYKYYGIAAHYGSIRKEIGDVSIERSVKLPYLDDLLKRLKDYWEEADDEIRGINVVAAFVKAIDNYKYDDWARTTNF